MKLLTILILLPCFCFGQKVDSLAVVSGNLIFSYGKITGTSATISNPKKDTIPIIMLVADTFFVEGWSTTIGVDSITYTMPNRLSNVWWMFGYEVRQSVFVPAHETHNGDGTITLFDDEYQDRLVGRLDQNRKPLPRSIIVWITKTIEK